MAGCRGHDGFSQLTVKREKVADGEIVLLTDSGIESSLEIYYTDNLGVNYWVTSGGDVHVNEDESLVSIFRNKSSERIILRYNSNTDRIYDIKTKKLVKGAHDGATDNVKLFDLGQLQGTGDSISEDEAAKYRQKLNLEIERNRLHK